MKRHLAGWGIAAVLVLGTVAAGADQRDAQTAAPLYHEQYRPQFHFSADKGWLNDPNGLVFFDGEYHLFFQYRPEVLVQSAQMSWGHAVSPDLVHWKQLPIALHPDDHDGWIWSGSAVVDWQNTSGFGRNGKPPLVAIYTAAKDPFSQAIAFSNDRGRTWTKYAGNPVIAHIANDNRDPHAFWYGPGKQWILVLFKDVNNTFCILSSPDLKNWKEEQEFQMPGCGECPDFFPLALDGDRSKIKWVFTAANGKYLVGDFDGHKFTPDQGAPGQEVRQVDFGNSFYAVQTFNDIPPADGRRIQVAWMRGGQYPGMPFNQQMSFPADLTLHSTEDGPRLFRYPVREIELLRGKQYHWNDLALTPGEKPLDGPSGDLFDIEAEIEPGDAGVVGLRIGNQTVTYERPSQLLRSLGDAPLPLGSGGRLHLRVLVDRTSIETFAQEGRVSLTSCFLPGGEARLSLLAKGGTARVHSLTVYELNSAWR